MHFSIVIPTYNSEKYIRRCLESILAVDYPPDKFEVIVVDGGSNDRTLQYVMSYPQVTILKSDNISIGNSRNIGARYASGKFLGFIDSDCLVTSDVLKIAEKHLRQYECCGSFYRSSDDHGWIARTWLLAERKKNGMVPWLPGGTLFVRQSFFWDIGGFNEHLHTQEDVEFARRVREKGGQLLNDHLLASVHLGQTDDLWSFFKKEMWRGKSLARSLFLQIRSGSKPPIFDIVIIIYLIALIGFFFSLFLKSFWIAGFMMSLIISIPALFTIRKSLQARKLKYVLNLFLLYFVFLMARSLSVLRYALTHK